MTRCTIRAVLLLCVYFGLLSSIGDPYQVNAAEKEDMTPLLLSVQLMDGPLSLASNGMPYEIDGFQVTGKTPGTEAFDHAEESGTPLAITSVSPPQSVRNGLPLDQLVIAFPASR